MTYLCYLTYRSISKPGGTIVACKTREAFNILITHLDTNAFKLEKVEVVDYDINISDDIKKYIERNDGIELGGQ